MVGRSDRCWFAWLLRDKAVAIGQRSALSCQPCSMFGPGRTQASRGTVLSVLNFTVTKKACYDGLRVPRRRQRKMKILAGEQSADLNELETREWLDSLDY